jgi:NosL
MRTVVSFVAGFILFVIVSCSSVTPVAIRTGDLCEGCRRPIQNVKIAAEIVPPAGRLPLKFHTVSCLARYIHEHGDEPGAVFVTDFDRGRMIQARSAIFVKSEIDENTKELDYYAFSDVASAVAFSKKSGGSATDWPSIVQRLAATGAD